MSEQTKEAKLYNSIIELNCSAAPVTPLREVPNAPPLANQLPPLYFNQKEKPRHRVALELAAKGKTPKEIAEQLGCAMQSVSNWLRQPHVQQTLVNEIRAVQTEDEKVVEVIRANVVDAVKTLAGIMGDTAARDSDRIAAAEKLLERRYGKANQPINRNTDVDLNNLSDEELVAMLPTDRTETNR